MGDNEDDKVGSLHVVSLYGNNQVTEMWTKSGFHGGNWHEARVFVGPVVNIKVIRIATTDLCMDVGYSLI